MLFLKAFAKRGYPFAGCQLNLEGVNPTGEPSEDGIYTMNLRDTSTEILIDFSSRLHKTHLDRLHGAERDVGKELGRGGGGEVERGPVQVGVLLAQDAGVDVLEDLVEAELAEALHGVANSSWSPSQEEASHTLLSHSELEAIAQALVLLLVHLQPTFHQIKRGHLGKSTLRWSRSFTRNMEYQSMGDATTEHSTKSTECKVPAQNI